MARVGNDATSMASVSDEYEHRKRDKYVSMMNENDTRGEFRFELTNLVWTRRTRQSWGAWVDAIDEHSILEHGRLREHDGRALI